MDSETRQEFKELRKRITKLETKLETQTQQFRSVIGRFNERLQGQELLWGVPDPAKEKRKLTKVEQRSLDNFMAAIQEENQQ